MIADISKVEIDPKYLVDSTGTKVSRDYAFCHWLCREKGVTAIPCTAFYPPETVHLGENLVRFAFCKNEDYIIEAGKRLSS